MFERFTDRGRHVVVLAQTEARALNHNYIGTEHLLLGLIGNGDGVGARILVSMGVSLDEVRRQLEEIVGRGLQEPFGHIPFTPRAKRVLELALRESVELGHNYIGTEHLLLGLLREREGVAAQVLVHLGAGLDRTRQRVVDTVGRGQAPPPEWTPPRIRPVRDRMLAVVEPAWRFLYHRGPLGRVVRAVGAVGAAGIIPLLRWISRRR